MNTCKYQPQLVGQIIILWLMMLGNIDGPESPINRIFKGDVCGVGTILYKFWDQPYRGGGLLNDIQSGDDAWTSFQSDGVSELTVGLFLACISIRLLA